MKAPAFITALLCLGAVVCEATVLLHQDFSSYPSGSIHGRTVTGPNVSGTWTATNDSYGTFSPDGGILSFTRTQTTSSTAVSKYAQFSVAATTDSTALHQEFWAMATISTDTLQAAFVSIPLHRDSGAAGQRIIFGIDSGKAFLATGASGATLSAQALSTTTPGTAGHTLLVRMAQGANTNDDIYHLWIDPDLGAEQDALGAPDVQITGQNFVWNGGSSLGSNTITANVSLGIITTQNATQPQGGSFSDIRVATTFESILVPEPGTTLLLVPGLALVCRRRRAV
ncbi:hypothetical protein OVA24_09415 [Luteolibacter sp. SL250]|uniref:hypothetical protein n=1 Tax=Luteolibacter sp. SL250 TaxID=2995170 RepID=UPI00226EC511|nr:hypothetical protein [Luteolibacter sp. SL250]WAC21601.1 hypothetical protein OVA24_09415 [Luteolibacter sp. SL250]